MHLNGSEVKHGSVSSNTMARIILLIYDLPAMTLEPAFMRRVRVASTISPALIDFEAIDYRSSGTYMTFVARLD